MYFLQERSTLWMEILSGQLLKLILIIFLTRTAFFRKGTRVLAFAYKECKKGEHLTKESENGYVFIGLTSIVDPPREESKEAVLSAINAGIKPVMITGDHKVTATAIAKQIGIYHDGDIALTGAELDKMSDKELDDILEKYRYTQGCRLRIR